MPDEGEAAVGALDVGEGAVAGETELEVGIFDRSRRPSGSCRRRPVGRVRARVSPPPTRDESPDTPCNIRLHRFLRGG